MYKTGMKFVELCKMTDSMRNIEAQATAIQDEKDDSAVADDEGFGSGSATGVAATADQSRQQHVIFKAEDFKEALSKGEELTLYHTLVTSNN